MARWAVAGLLVVTAAARGADERKAVEAVLDDWHAAAAAADEGRYFGMMTADAVFLGTDATERWTRDDFRKWAHPHFAKGKAWKFKAVRRDVALSPAGDVAWFDEDLATVKLGPCRGSGVLVREGGTWKVAQYNLSVPIPNEIFDKVRKEIAEALEAKKEGRSK